AGFAPSAAGGAAVPGIAVVHARPAVPTRFPPPHLASRGVDNLLAPADSLDRPPTESASLGSASPPAQSPLTGTQPGVCRDTPASAPCTSVPTQRSIWSRPHLRRQSPEPHAASGPGSQPTDPQPAVISIVHDQ